MIVSSVLMQALINLLQEADLEVLEVVCGGAKAGGHIDLHRAKKLAIEMPQVLRWDENSRQLLFRFEEDREAVGTILQNRKLLLHKAVPVDVDYDEIILALNERRYGAVAELLDRHGGAFAFHYFGYEKFASIADRIPTKNAEANDTLVEVAAMYALMMGATGRAKNLLISRFGAAEFQFDAVENTGNSSNTRRVVCLEIAIREDSAPSQILTAAVNAMRELDVNEYALHGNLCRIVMISAIMTSDFPVASVYAENARKYFLRASLEEEVIHVELLRALAEFKSGRVQDSRISLSRALMLRKSVVVSNPSCRHLSNILEIALSCEDGGVFGFEDLLISGAGFSMSDKLMSVLLEPIVSACSNVILGEKGVGSAIDFIEKWRANEPRSRRTHFLATLCQIEALQAAGRWTMAVERLGAIQSRVSRSWMAGVIDELSRLRDPLEIRLAATWLRDFVEHQPRRHLLREQVRALTNNEVVGERTRTKLQLLGAHLARINRDVSGSRRELANFLESCARSGAVSHLWHDHRLLAALLADKRIGSQVLAYPEMREVAERLTPPWYTNRPDACPLSSQELRVLRLVAGGAIAKTAAAQLGVAETTIKFHLTKIYRKLGVGCRAEAIAAATAAGWLQ